MGYRISPAICHFYPRSPCGERRKSNKLAGLKLVFLSTLSLRRATYLINTYHRIFGISIHALLAESDGKPHKLAGQKLVFLSTLSLRRATFSTFLPIRVVLFLSTLSLRRATIMTITICTALKFLSTLSLRRATPNPVCIMITIIISIHALLAESDQRHPQTLNHPHNFYPRSPCGERP